MHRLMVVRKNPTYEDMLLLSSLLGPAKPPVASREDVASPLGVHQIRPSGGLLVAAGLDGISEIPIAPGERCLVCLCEYEANEQVRQLVKCTHMFHRECIDEVCLPRNGILVSSNTYGETPQWLTTGRNSCPLCRGQGVDEKVAT